MKHYVGIDLGTTNSAISSFNGETVRIWKSPEQNDVTPSVIFFAGGRGNKYVGTRAYDQASRYPDNSASLFKRLMGTSTPITLSGANVTMTPEQCSSEILKVLFGYLSEEIRDSDSTGTVVTVPAAFNQMQKDATKKAAELAGIGRFALMQEPVAAVMSAIRTQKFDGTFVVYDLGGGTLDVAIAESSNRRINLLSHGGIAMCGGRDWDRVLIDNVIKPWLFENFDLPDDLTVDPTYKTLFRMAYWATERAKIELSSSKTSVISLSEMEIETKDLSNSPIFLEVPLDRMILDSLIEDRVNASIEAVRETMDKAGLTANDIERLVFVGGPTNYKPLRDKVSFELGLPSNSDLNPMTAVSEGAAFFAESIDWDSESRGRKSTRASVSPSSLSNVSFDYITRTPDRRAKIAIRIADEPFDGGEFQVDGIETGWTSGKLALKNDMIFDVLLEKDGENIFEISIFDNFGRPIKFEKNRIVITRTVATVEAIPVSHSIGIEVLEKLGGRPTLEWLIRSGDQLPKNGSKSFKVSEALKAGSPSSINFKIWEGEIEDPISDNRFVGTMKVSGSDFDEGIIAVGSDIQCDFEILDSGNIFLEISIPSIGGIFHSGKNFYSRRESQIDFSNAFARIAVEVDEMSTRVNKKYGIISDSKELDKVRQKLDKASIIGPDCTDLERVQEAMELIFEAKKLLAQVRKQNLKILRQVDLDDEKKFFDNHLREHARSNEEKAFDNLCQIAQREIERSGTEFENYVSAMKDIISEIYWRVDRFVIASFKRMINSPWNFSDQDRFEKLSTEGMKFLQSNDIENLKLTVFRLYRIQIRSVPETDILDVANIVRG